MNTSTRQLQIAFACVVLGIIAALVAAAIAALRGLAVQAMFELGGAMFLVALAAGIWRRKNGSLPAN